MPTTQPTPLARRACVTCPESAVIWCERCLAYLCARCYGVSPADGKSLVCSDCAETERRQDAQDARDEAMGEYDRECKS